jgi:hypothetical protein
MRHSKDGYRWPGDTDGPDELTFGQAVFAARTLTDRISRILGVWSDREISLRIVRRGRSYATYELSQFGHVVSLMPVFLKL